MKHTHMKRLRDYLRGFYTREDGTIAVETILILPALFWAYLSMFAIFDAYRQHATTQKSTYTISDVVSRETNPIDLAYLSGTREMLAYLTSKPVDRVSVRITSVKYDADNDIYKRDWSKSKGWMPALTNSAVEGMRDLLPVMPHNERVTVVETFVKYKPPFKTGLSERTIHNLVFTRPRYAPRVLWAD